MPDISARTRRKRPVPSSVVTDPPSPYLDRYFTRVPISLRNATLEYMAAIDRHPSAYRRHLFVTAHATHYDFFASIEPPPRSRRRPRPDYPNLAGYLARFSDLFGADISEILAGYAKSISDRYDVEIPRCEAEAAILTPWNPLTPEDEHDWRLRATLRANRRHDEDPTAVWLLFHDCIRAIPHDRKEERISLHYQYAKPLPSPNPNTFLVVDYPLIFGDGRRMR